jgi:hypothetical protein
MQGFPMSLWSYQGHRHTLVEAGMGAALADGKNKDTSTCKGEKREKRKITARLTWQWQAV